MNKNEICSQQISPAYRAIYFPQLLKANFMPETVVFHPQPAYIYLIESNYNNSRIQCEMCAKLTIEALDANPLLLMLNIFDTLF